jgi:hypothetical protein
MKKDLEQKFKRELMKLCEKATLCSSGKINVSSTPYFLYWKLFGKTCKSFDVAIFEKEDKISLRTIDTLIENRRQEYVYGSCEYPTPAQIDFRALMENTEFTRDLVTYSEFESRYFYLWRETIIMVSLNKGKTSVSLFTANEKEAEDFLELITLLRPNNRKKNTYTFLVKSDDGLNEKKLSFERQEVDLKKNYNDDLPWNEMMRFVGSEEEGLAILYGPAGTGKTTLIKHLIQENPEKNFILINSKDLENPDSEYYLEYFLENDNRIFILEDCEKLLLTRNQGGGSNQLITILNMTDGLLGSTLKTKFICTFNTDLRNIDTALLRKGRMKVKYYVGPLCIEKTRELMNDETIQKEMTLAEIYNQEENDFSKTSQKRIGF